MARHSGQSQTFADKSMSGDEFHQAFTNFSKGFASENSTNFASVREIAVKRGILVHDVDAGRPCMKCGDKCPGFALHFWRKVCRHCKCPWMEHDIHLIDELGTKVQNYYFSLDEKYDHMNWIPKGLTKQLIEVYLNSLPQDKNPSRPCGINYRHRQLIYQLPEHDTFLYERNREKLTDIEFQQVRAFIQLRKDRISRAKIRANLSDLALNCSCCDHSLKIGDAAIMVDEIPPIFFHPHCFICNICKELLVDLIYFISNNKLYCGRHHAETLKPRCAACDELIFSKEFTRAEGLNWHLHHFCCIECDSLLGGQKYMVADNGHPYCLLCFSRLFSKGCSTCGSFIGVDDPRLSHGDFDWHGTSVCFRCNFCCVSLLGSPFIPKGNYLYCSKDCYKSDKFRKTL
ncbi:prickle/testin-like protein [Oopsacas minuta]|uniref:Prickle/testin-like protein n=1 Tax=Oopsacas minuta TaxID=111878 RepID=A0A142F4Y6_9METZ|nr:prickle/testin-like protein [Oopsacas minuta]KAI6659897.1 prickle/testin-like protein [Oopsacas minuta]